MAILPDGRLETIHVQVGTDVYIFALDQILPNDGELYNKVKGLPEVAGSAQGEGIETVWWDSSEEPVMMSMDAKELKVRADFVRSLGYTGPVAETETKEKLVVQLQRKGRKSRRT